MTTAAWGGKSLFSFHFTSLFTTGGSQELEQGRIVEAGGVLLTGFLLNMISYRTQEHPPRDGTTHNGLGLPLSIAN